jgi:iron complex outermembrane receptor protein
MNINVPSSYLAAVPLMLTSILAVAENTSKESDHQVLTKAIYILGEAEASADALLTPESSAITQPVKDSGELLRAVNGVTATRRAGHGFEPIIRGQQQGQLNILSDGGHIVSACPSRMDPATSYIGMESFDSVTVIKGNRSVIYGSGGSGGTVIFERERPVFEDGKPYKGKVTLGYTENSEATSGSFDLSVGADRGFIRAYAETTDSGNYDDGDGNTISSAYQSLVQGVMLGADITSTDYLQLGYEQSRQDEVLYAGNGMDSPFADADHLRGKWLHSGSIGFVDELEITAYRSDVNHLMDNYTVRVRNPMMRMAAPSSTDSWGGRLLATSFTDSTEFRYGGNYRASNQEATRYMDNDFSYGNGYAMTTSILWPDVQFRNAGLFAEADYSLSNKDTLRAGIRVDHWTADANSSSSTYGMMPPKTPNELYQASYGYQAKDRSEDHMSFVLGWDRALAYGLALNTNFSGTSRAPDANELYIASDSSMMTNWVGNPALDFEQHYQLDVSLSQTSDSYAWSATAFYDRVNDYIERYVEGSGMASVYKYKNVDAVLGGLELEAQYQPHNHVTLRGTASYTRGMNTDDSTDLARMAPLEVHTFVDYETERWGTGLEWVLAEGQAHINQTSGLDASESEGFGVLHWKAHVNIEKGLTLKAGVENVLDRAYAYHVNAANADPFSPTAVVVNEPGRQFWVKGEYLF